MSIRNLLVGTPVLLPVCAAFAGAPEAVDQPMLNAMVAEDPLKAFIYAFEAGDELTEAQFTSAHGVGARVSANQRFTRLPRADLIAGGEWADHFPVREGGPQAQSCITCHAVPLANGAGGVALNVAIDPQHTGDPTLYLERNTLHLFGLGAVQRIAEEMTLELQAKRDDLGARVCATGEAAKITLSSKGTLFGTLAAAPEGTGAACVASYDESAIEGVDADLVVRMFGWKGTHATIRDFSRNAAHNEMGMQGAELVGAKDGDHDGVTNELSVGDLTAITVYIAGLERPTSKIELADHGLIDLPSEQRAQIEAGEVLFAATGCADCHRPITPINAPRFDEPSTVPGFFDVMFPGGDAPKDLGLAAATAVSFDLTADQPNNRIKTGAGEVLLGAYPRDDAGRALVAWYSDFRRHDMGEGLADPMDAYGFGESVWPTRSLAGVGSTGPWLHDGRATTLSEAIMWHGGAAQSARDAFAALQESEQRDIIAFLDSLVIENFDPEEDH